MRHMLKTISVVLLLLICFSSAYIPVVYAQERSMQVTANVPTPTYYVEIPQKVSFSNLTGSTDSVHKYNLSVESKWYKPGYMVTVTAPKSISLVNQFDRSKTLTCYNSLNYVEVTGSKKSVHPGSLTIKGKDVQKASVGSYNGSLTFNINYKKQHSDGYENGRYNSTVHFYQTANSNALSMCDPIFCHTADISLTDDEVTVSVYVAYPIPAFSSMGTDGTIKNMYMVYNGKRYNGTMDISSKTVKTFDTAGEMFGINSGDKLTTEKLTITLPRSAIDSFKSGIETSAYVNVMMNSDQSFIVKFTDLKFIGSNSNNNNNNNGNQNSNNNSNNNNNNNNQNNNGNSSDNPNNTGNNAKSNTANGSSDIRTATSGNYTCSVSMRKATDINSLSMCNPLFYKKADIAVNGDNAELTLYVIDPIPMYDKLGTPLTDISFLANNQSFAAQINSANKESKYFDFAAGFINNAGNYNASPVTVTVPKSAVINSQNGSLKCQAYVAVVMKTTQSFYVVLSDFTSENSDGTSSAGSSTQGSSSTKNSAGANAKNNKLSGDSSDKSSAGSKENFDSSQTNTNTNSSDNNQSGNTNTLPKQYSLVTNSLFPGLVFLLITTAATVGYYYYKKRCK